MPTQLATEAAPRSIPSRIAARAALAAPALAPAAAPAPDEAPARPQLALVSPEPAQRALARSAAERLAAQTGGALEAGEGGLRTVHFPSPELPALSTAPFTVSRDLSEAGATSQPAALEHPPAESPGATDPEALYEYFLDRFKRDLLIEREQSGHLIIDNP